MSHSLARKAGHAPEAGPVSTGLCGGDYAFLLDGAIELPTLRQAEALADAWGVTAHDVLIAKGWLSADDYARALARRFGLAYASDAVFRRMAPPERSTLQSCLQRRVMQLGGPHVGAAVDPSHVPLQALGAAATELRRSGVVLASRGQLRAAIDWHFRASLVDGAVNDLRRRHPEHSAAFGVLRSQKLAVGGSFLALLAAMILAPAATTAVLMAVLGCLFLPVVLLRAIAVADVARGIGREPEGARVPDRELPVYTVLAPLYREANVAPHLLAALARFDYPAAKLDIKLILEASDADTIAAARAAKLPGNVEIVIVPDMQPRTKPKALNYALPFARGELLAIYDAEDRPEPDQLRKACAAFRAGPPNLACVQARLTYDNARENWLTRQFAIEYSALFDGLLPTLARLGLPIPLGGTSNHFRVAALKWLCGWDPFNVTEDADLGIRLARRGYRCRMIDSVTYEEATSALVPWIKQRTRWLKGYMQTYAVHMRAPVRLWREVGPRAFVSIQATIGGLLLSTLVHPWFYVLALIGTYRGTFLALPQEALGWPLWLLAGLNLTVGYLASMGLGFMTVRRSGRGWLAPHVLMMPAYWLLASIAAYRALLQMRTDPFLWEKTAHGVSRHRATPEAPAA